MTPSDTYSWDGPGGRSRRRASAGLLRVRLAGLAHGADHRALAGLLAVLANHELAAVRLVVDEADADAAVARLAIEHDVGDGERRLLRQPAALRVEAARLEVLVDQVHPFDDDLVLLVEDADDAPRTTRVGVLAGDHHHQVVFANVHGAHSC